MATTTNYGWTTPDDTALVKDGAAAIRSLGTAIDTSMNTALGTKKSGLVLLNTTSFSAVSSQSINNVFSATYDRYRILLNATFSANDGFYVRLRASGTDATASEYGTQLLRADSTTVAGSRVAATSWDFNGTRSSGNELFEIEIFNPFGASPTYGFTRYVAKVLTDTTQVYSTHTGFIHSASTSYDGFTFLRSGATATATGTLSVFGYNK